MICLVITGVDGTGKTTLAKQLCTHLINSGNPSSYMYGRLIPVTSRALMWMGRNIFLRKSYQSNDYGLYRKKTRETLQNPLYVYPYLISIWFDYLLEIWLKLLPHLLSGRILILDRYVYDTIISDIAAHVQMDDSRFKKMIDFWFLFLLRPVRTYVMYVPEDVSFNRKNDIPHIEYLRERHHWYELLEDRDEVRALDGTGPIETNIHIIIEDLLDMGIFLRQAV